jgi:hypothetical protein
MDAEEYYIGKKLIMSTDLSDTEISKLSKDFRQNSKRKKKISKRMSQIIKDNANISMEELFLKLSKSFTTIMTASQFKNRFKILS